MASSDLAANILNAPTGGVTPDMALQVRKTIYAHDPLTSSDMDLVFEVAQKAGRNPCPEWKILFCEAMADYVVHQNTPIDYIPTEKAEWLIAEFTKRGGISSEAEFALLIDLMTSALSVPPSLSAFALKEIKNAIINGRRDAIGGEDHPAGVVAKADVEALRTVLYAATTGTPGHVTQDEAEVLFEIAHATARGQIDPAFDELFARAVGNYLMAINMHVADAAEELHREKWLDEEGSLSGFLSRTLSHAPGASVFDLLKSPSQIFEADVAKREAGDQVLRNESEKITDSEASWVVAHLTRDGELTSAEKSLLQFLGAEAPSMPESLHALIDKVSATAKSA